MPVLAVIPARYASTRFPGKPLAVIAGKPMVQRVWEQTRLCPAVQDVLVATDDPRIAEVVQGFGGQVLMTRPDHPTGTDRLAEVAERVPEYDLYLNIQGDEPFIAPESIAAACEMMHQHPEVPIGTLVRRLTDAEALHSPHTVKVVRDDSGQALYFSRSPIPFVRDTDPQQWPTQAVFWQHIGLYAFRRAAVLAIAQLPRSPLEQAENLEQLRWLEAGYRIQCAETQHPSWGVDVPEDIDRVLKLAQWNS
jgi:3-deoxy-manno-octulosonate cytidylyltransferase (CMP-KDO synthetase)